MDYVTTMQEMFYQNRIGNVYGCFEVIDIQFDPEIRKQVWTMKCIHCGMIKVTHNGKDYVKGKNHGICKCQHSKKIVQSEIKSEKTKRLKMQDHELYSRWKSIKNRCYVQSDKDYHNYGGRGIKMCDDWKNNFWSFVEWANQSGYEKDLTIDRINVDGDYCPDNCRWVGRFFQNKNKRNIKLYDELTLPDYCKLHGLCYNTMQRLRKEGLSLEESLDECRKIKERKDFNKKCEELGVRAWDVRQKMAKGMSFDEATHKPNSTIEINGEVKTLTQWCSEYNITPSAVKYRMDHGMSPEEAITTPKQQGNKFLDV